MSRRWSTRSSRRAGPSWSSNRRLPSMLVLPRLVGLDPNQRSRLAEAHKVLLEGRRGARR
jgi:hypothetical protein